MLDENAIKEELSIAYVRAVASRAGFAVEETRKDFDSVDLKIRAKGKLVEDAVLEAPELAIQLKATAMETPLTEDTFSFSLKQKNFRDLARTTLVPRILVVFVLPMAVASWVVQDEESLVMRRCAYWLSLRGAADTGNTTSTTVELRRSQTLSPRSLRALLERVAREEDILP